MNLRNAILRWRDKTSRRFARRLVALGDESGSVAVEFAFIGLVMLGSFQFATTFYNYIGIANAVSVGTRTFEASKGSATPFTTTRSAMTAALPSTITKANVTMTLAVNGVACVSDSDCTAKLISALPVTITATYPCPTNSLKFYGTDYAPVACTLRSSTTGRVP